VNRFRAPRAIRVCLAFSLALALGACSKPHDTESLVHASLSAERLGVKTDALASEWLEQLRARVASRPRLTLFAFEPDHDPVPGAEAVLATGWKLREHPPLRLQPPIAWSQVQDGDVNWHYELNALKPLDELLAAYVATQKPAYIEPARALLLDWIDFNLTRDKSNDKKWYDMGTGYRAEKLAFVTEDALRSGALPAHELALLLDAAVEHARVLSKPSNLSRGNHGVFMMLGLAALCHSLPELTGCDKDAAYAQQTLTKILEKQFDFEEAIHLEGSPGYHLFMSSTLAALGRTGLFKDNPKLSDLFVRTAANDYRMFHPNGDPVLIGDSGPNQLKNFASSSAETRFVLSDGREGSAPAPESRAFPRTGYAVFRSPWSQHPFSQHSFLFFSAASHDSAHSQLDHFSFEWSERGQPLLVDSGKYTYTKGPLRDFFRSTRAGNALEIDGKDLERVEKLSSLRSFGQAGPLWFADAVAQRAGKVEHTRVLVLQMGQWLCVIDRLKARSSHRYRQWFHFDEHLQARVEGESVIVDSPAPGPKLFVRSLAGPAPVPELVKGSKEPYQGWISLDYEQMVPRYSVAFGESGADVDLVTLFALDAAVSEPQLTRSAEGVSVQWKRNGAAEGFRYRVEGGQGKLSGEP
jgi:hypothetical protein